MSADSIKRREAIVPQGGVPDRKDASSPAVGGASDAPAAGSSAADPGGRSSVAAPRVPQPITAATRGSRERMQLCVAVVMLGFVAATYLHYWIGVYEGSGYPESTYLYRPMDSMGVTWQGAARNHCFSDFYGQWIVAGLPTPYTQMPWGQGSNYLPFTHVLMMPVGVVPYWAALPVYLALTAGVCFWYCWHGLRPLPGVERTIGATALALMAYPVQFLLDRGNIETLVFAFLVGFHLLYAARRPYLAAASLAGAIAIKGYPAVFGLVFLNRGQLKPLLVCGVVAVLLTLQSAQCFEGGMARTLQACLAGMNQYAASRPLGEMIGGGSSLWGLAVILASLFGWSVVLRAPFLAVAENFPVVQVILAVGLVAAFTLLRFRLWESLALCCFAMMALLKVGPDYRLVHWLLPVMAFIGARGRPRWATASAVLLGLLLIPKGIVLGGEVKITALFNPLIMLAIVGLIVAEAAARPPAVRPGVIVLEQLRRAAVSLPGLRRTGAAS